jgi:hypothetical protein
MEHYQTVLRNSDSLNSQYNVVVVVDDDDDDYYYYGHLRPVD